MPAAVRTSRVHLPFTGDASRITVVEGAREHETVVFGSGAADAVVGVTDVSVVNGAAVVSINSGTYRLRLISE